MHLPALFVLDAAFIRLAPSNARPLGALPYIYLIAAFPLALIARQLWRVFPKPVALALGAALCGGVLLHSYQQNYHYYFEDLYGKFHAHSCCKERDAAKVIRGFAESDGAIGNAIIVPGASAPERRQVMFDAGARGLSALARRFGVFAILDCVRASQRAVPCRRRP